jgi:hypothetical protein
MIDRNDAEAISAYLDENLAPREKEHLETRLRQEPALRSELEALRRTRDLLRSAPHFRAPRNFTLTPEMAGIPAGMPGIMFSVTRIAFTMSAILFVVALAGNFTFIALPAAQPEQPAAFALATEPVMESLDQSAAPAEGDAAGAAEAEPMQALEPGTESVDSGEDAGAPESFDPTTEESASIAEESAESLPVEDPVVEGTVTVEAADAAPATEEALSLEAVVPSAGSDRTAAGPEPAETASKSGTGRINPWSIFTVLTGLAALLSGGLAYALRRK